MHAGKVRPPPVHVVWANSEISALHSPHGPEHSQSPSSRRVCCVGVSWDLSGSQYHQATGQSLSLIVFRLVLFWACAAMVDATVLVKFETSHAFIGCCLRRGLFPLSACPDACVSV
ncbi:hypothetical protein RRG08_029651 [Elysia crispata]|uniref:Uncharacterized protein n=1 Tax=Elysia crispata TaxID=231223 RepID=A0AAE1CJN1_9GAST|nr:hypothetical protein RRG08_029651 [Elysia crispata]